MKRIILLCWFGIALSLQGFAQLDITKRQVTLDSIAARVDSTYLLGPVRVEDTAKFTNPVYINGVFFNGTIENISGNNNEILLSDGGGSTKTDADFTWNDTTLDATSVLGANNISIGYQSLENATGGNNSIYIGYRSGRNIGTGNNNVFFGVNTGVSTTNGGNNVFIGNGTGFTNILGNSNTYIGSSSGYNSTGYRNVFLGYFAGFNETGSDKLYIENSNSTSPLIYGEFDNDLLKINGTQIQSTDTIPDNDATPDVSAANVWTYNGTANSVTVTDLDNPDVGAIYRIIGNSDTYTITINDSGNFNLSANWVGGIDDVLTIFVQADNDYIEISRTNN